MKTGCFIVLIPMADLAAAVPYQFRLGHAYTIGPFTIDIDGQTVNGVRVRMKVLWDARN